MSETSNSYTMVAPPNGPLSRSGVIRSGRGVFWARTGASSFDEEFERRGVTVGRSLVGAYVAALNLDEGLVHFLRDDLGQVPLYWTRVEGGVVFSSVIRDLKDLPGRTDRIDQEVFALRTRKTYRHLWERTAFAGVFRARQGGVTTITTDAVNFECTWDPSSIQTQQRSFPETVEAMQAAIRASVDAEVSDSESVGVHLSGGMDSTICAAYLQQARRHRNAPGIVAGFSWSPDSQHVKTPGFHDGDLASAHASALGIPFYHVPSGFLGLPDRDPILDPHETLWREYSALRTARDLGIRVMISGWGGDEAASFSGRHLLVNMLRRGELTRMWSLQREYGRGRLDALRGVAGAAKQWPRRHRASRERQLHNDDLPQRMLAARCSSEMITALFGACYVTNRLEHWWEEGRRLGIEYRYPLLNRHVIEVAVQTPDGHWRQGEQGRAVMRELIAQAGLDGELAPAKSQPALNVLVHRIAETDPTPNLTDWPEQDRSAAIDCARSQRIAVRALLASRRQERR